MKNFILASTILSILDIVLLTICYAFFIEQFSFGDFIEELYKKFNLDMNDDETHGNYITIGIEELFNNYQDISGL